MSRYNHPSSTKKDLNQSIRAAGKRKNIDEVVKIWRSLGAEADAYTYAAVITAAGNNNRMDLAEEAFRMAIDPRNYQVDVVTLNCMITAAGNNNRMDLAIDIYNYALSVGQANAITFLNFNDTRINNKFPGQPVYSAHSYSVRYRNDPYSWHCSQRLFAIPRTATQQDIHTTPSYPS